MSFWQGNQGVAGSEHLNPFLERYIADETLLMTDGNRAYLEFYLNNLQKQNALFQVCHKKGEFTRKEKHRDLNGKKNFFFSKVSSTPIFCSLTYRSTTN